MRQYFVQPTAATPACTASVSLPHLSICLSARLLPVYPYICLPVYLSIRLSVYLSLCLSVHHVVCFTALLFTQLFHCCNCNCCLILLTSISINCRQAKQRGLCLWSITPPPTSGTLPPACISFVWGAIWTAGIASFDNTRHQHLAKYHRTLCSQSVVNF